MASGKSEVFATPELIVEGHAPQLSPEQQQVLERQWQQFWSVRSESGSTAMPSSSLIPAGSFVHHAGYDPSALSLILSSGVLSGEVGHPGKTLTVEDGETHYAADFFVIPDATSVDDYTLHCRTAIQVGRLRKQPPESFAAPGPRTNTLALVFPPSQQRHGLLQYAATANTITGGPLDGWPMQFPSLVKVQTVMLRFSWVFPQIQRLR